MPVYSNELKIKENKEQFLSEIEEKKKEAVKKMAELDKKNRRRRRKRKFNRKSKTEDVRSPEERNRLAEKVHKKKIKSFVDFSLQTPKLVPKNNFKIKGVKKRSTQSMKPKDRKSIAIDEFNKVLDQSPKTLQNSFQPDKIKNIASSAFGSE